MNVIVCVDNNNGMMFNNRRQSSDRILRKKIFEIIKDKSLYMNTYSYIMYEKDGFSNIIADDDYLDKAGKGDYCFVEKESLMSYADKIENIILCKWNTIYPSDKKLDIDVDTMFVNKGIICEFEGSSHDRITIELLAKC